MTVRTFTSVEELKNSVGEQMTPTEWLTIDQDQVNAFADVTGDHQWIHVDVDKAKNTPFGGTIVHGFFTLSLIPVFTADTFAVEIGSATLNYGLEKVRFLAPVPVGSRLRGVAEMVSVEEKSSGVQFNTKWTIEIEGQDTPACVAEFVGLIIGAN